MLLMNLNCSNKLKYLHNLTNRAFYCALGVEKVNFSVLSPAKLFFFQAAIHEIDINKQKTFRFNIFA